MQVDKHEDRWLSTGPKREHQCRLPGLFERFGKKARPGALWRCGTCKQIWEWSKNPGPELNWRKRD